jgi:hypothetical protein
MKYSFMLRWKFSIIKSDDIVILIFVFVMLQLVILNIAIVNFQCYDGASVENFFIGRSSTSSFISYLL